MFLGVVPQFEVLRFAFRRPWHSHWPVGLIAFDPHIRERTSEITPVRGFCEADIYTPCLNYDRQAVQYNFRHWSQSMLTEDELLDGGFSDCATLVSDAQSNAVEYSPSIKLGLGVRRV